VTPRVDPMNACPGLRLGTDKISVPVYITTEIQGPSSQGGAYVYNYNYCAQDVLYPNYDETKPFWKSGADRYCSTDWPYEASCPKHGVGCMETDGMGGSFPRDCRCGEPGAQAGDQWPDDPLDDVVYGLSDFLEIALQLLPPRGGTITLADRAAQLVRTFDQWYPAIADFIEPGLYSGAVPNVDCFICKQEDGYLHQWALNLENMSQRLTDWLDEGYWGSSCTEVWCMPDPALQCPEL